MRPLNPALHLTKAGRCVKGLLLLVEVAAGLRSPTPVRIVDMGGPNMEHRALAALVLRFTGLVVLVTTITNATGQLLVYFVPDPTVPDVGSARVVLVVLLVVVPVAIALLLIYFPSAVLTRVLRVPGLKGPFESDILPLQRVAFAALGLWFVLDGITDAAYVAAQNRWFFRVDEAVRLLLEPGYEPPLSAHEFSMYVVGALRVVLGLALLVGSGALARLLAKLRAWR